MLLACGTALAALMLFFMQAMTTFTYDDYYYAVFLRDGLSGFLTQNVTHYLVRNGRVLVHAAVELLLAAGTWAYSLANLLILGGVLTLGLRYLRTAEVRQTDRTLLAGWAAALVLAGSYRVFGSWLLCPADSANYMLPLLSIFGMVLAMRRGSRWPAVILALLCGASTELCSATGFVIAALELLDERLRKNRWNRLRLLCLGCILCGLATILLSPATQQRVSRELSLSGIGFSFLRYANSIAAPGTSLPLLTIVSVLLGLGVPGKAWVRMLSIPTALLLASGWLIPRSTMFTAAAFAVFCVYLFLCAVVMILDGRERRCGFALLSGLACAAIMTLSSSCSIRVTIPFVLILLVCSLHLLQCIHFRCPERRSVLRCAAALCVWTALVLHIPTLQGIAGNWRIMHRNEASMTPEAVTYTDYDPRYCPQQLFMSADFERVYLKYLGLEGADVRYNYTFGPELTIGSSAQTCILYRDSCYLPLRAAVEAAGGTVDMISDGFLEIRLADACFLYQRPKLYTPDGVLDAAWDFISVENRYYISTDLLESALGIDPARWEG